MIVQIDHFDVNDKPYYHCTGNAWTFNRMSDQWDKLDDHRGLNVKEGSIIPFDHNSEVQSIIFGAFLSLPNSLTDCLAKIAVNPTQSWISLLVFESERGIDNQFLMYNSMTFALAGLEETIPCYMLSSILSFDRDMMTVHKVMGA